ncbi:hypothetical protein GCM10007094_26250 [Pseudovibrio japonicus]|uniref:Uncharacterized protein n=1 Tax=Pseudovibrio japonicus TaxID=366534 RepID=A0ABQ3EHT5_9HYPH|nr:hypothetical protein [Pseudovibrio japonicus]GHB35436.1 hypothetical protein GCM10007094_26250 [Pseudovibrio japonicus]
MRAAPLPFVAVFALVTAGLTSPLGANTDAAQASRNISISELSMQDGSPDASVCTQRYGNGYTVSPSQDAPRRIFVSDQGHTITLVDRSEIMGQGIFAEHDRFMMTFPPDTTEEIEVTQFVTGLIGGDAYSGVFTDGTCTGKIMAGPWMTP